MNCDDKAEAAHREYLDDLQNDKLDNLLKAASNVVVKHNLGTLAGPNDSLAILNLEKAIKGFE